MESCTLSLQCDSNSGKNCEEGGKLNCGKVRNGDVIALEDIIEEKGLNLTCTDLPIPYSFGEEGKYLFVDLFSCHCRCRLVCVSSSRSHPLVWHGPSSM